MSENQDLSTFGEGEASEADVQEQAEAVGDTDTETTAGTTESAEVDEFDAAEQGRAIDLDPDEYR